jgi:hypothetical protein
MKRLLILVLCIASPAREACARQGVSSGAETVFLVPREPRDTIPNRAADVRVVVRDVLRPGLNLRAFDVQLEGPTMLLHGAPDSSGVARFAALPPGLYKVRARAGGYLPLEVHVDLGPGCPTWVEVYLTTRPCDIGFCPPAAPARAAITACEPMPGRKKAP